jgi:hypothetical protein
MFSFPPRALMTLLVLSAPAYVAGQTAPAQTPPTESISVQYGVRFGPSFTSLTSVEAFDPTAAPAAFEPTMNFGGFAVVDMPGPLSFQPEVLFASKGQRIRSKTAQPATTPTGEVELPAADRVVLVRYLEFPMLLRMSKVTHENTSLYAIAGIAFALHRNSVIREVVDAGRKVEISDLVSATDMSFIVGGGLQHRRWLVDARVTRGMKNIAADPAQMPVKTRAFAVLMGVRF